MAVKKLKLQPQPLTIPEGFKLLPSAILLYQKSTRTLWGNPSFEDQFGLADLGRFSGTGPLHLIREKPVTEELFSSIGRHEGLVLRNRAGEKNHVELKVSNFGNPIDDTYLILIDDVSIKYELQNEVIRNHLELKQTQQALIQSAKMTYLGEMATGLAHELNQPLQLILGFTQELQQTESLTVSGQEFMTEIEKASRHMSDVIRKFRTFAKPSNQEFSETCVETVIEEAAGIWRHSLMQKDIDLILDLKTPLPLVRANATEFKQVLINLIGNSRDAIEEARRERGKITIQAERMKETLQIRITDNGCGMDETTQSKLFTPFFTTKSAGKGTGLGMSISYSILKAMNAEISLTSKPGIGTEITLRIPILNTETKGENT